jgi:hypothetical protein
MMRMLTAFVLFGLAIACAIDIDITDDSVVGLDETSPALFSDLMKPKFGQDALVEVAEGEQEGATMRMSAADREAFKAQFRSLASNIHARRLRSNVLIAERMASDAMDKTDDSGGGMDLIFNKLEELEQEIKDEQEEDDTWITNQRDTAKKRRDEYMKNIEDAEKQIRENNLNNKKDQNDIDEWRRQWHASRSSEAGEGGTHPLLKKMQATRSTESAIVREQVDERNKALDVLIEALFLVCERFNRYKNTALCMQIKSQPDVEEPDRYETKEADEAKAETDELHADGSAFAELWENQKFKDLQKQDVMCPETPDDCPEANQSGITEIHSVRIIAEDQFKIDSVLLKRLLQLLPPIF